MRTLLFTAVVMLILLSFEEHTCYAISGVRNINSRYAKIQIKKMKDIEYGGRLFVDSKEVRFKEDGVPIKIVRIIHRNTDDVLFVEQVYGGSSGMTDYAFVILYGKGKYRVIELPVGAIDKNICYLPDYKLSNNNNKISVVSKIYSNIIATVELNGQNIRIIKKTIKPNSDIIDENVCKEMYLSYSNECHDMFDNIDMLSMASQRFFREYMHDPRFNKIKFNKLCKKAANGEQLIRYYEFRRNICFQR